MIGSDVSVRLISAQDCAGVVALIRDCYGDSYGVDYFYHIDALIEEIESGRLKSVVALKNNKIVGHMALLQTHPKATVCEAGNTVVHSSMRGEGVMMQLAIALHKLAVGTGLSAYIQYPTTAHGIMQKASVNHGGTEVGIMLRYIETQESSPALNKRLAATIAYQPVDNPLPKTIMRLPKKYEGLLKNLYLQPKLPRQINDEPCLPSSANSNLTVRFNSRWKLLQINIESTGENLQEKIASILNRYQYCACYLDLPVDANGINQTIETLNKLGFFFAGLLPDFSQSDVLRLQKLPNAMIEDFQPKLVNKTGLQLLSHLQKEAQFIGVLP